MCISLLLGTFSSDNRVFLRFYHLFYLVFFIFPALSAQQVPCVQEDGLKKCGTHVYL